MDRKIFLNYLYNIFYQIVKIVLPFFLVPYTMSHLGASTLGISDFASNISAWFILFGILGINVYGSKQLAKVRDDKDELSKQFFEILSVQIINMIVVTILYILYIVLFVNENQLIYYLVLITVISSAFDITWFYYAIENFKTVSIRNVIVKLLGVACIFAFVKKPEDLWLYVVINGVSDLIGHLITYSGLHKYIRLAKFNIIDAYKNHLVPTFLLFIPTIAINVYTLLDQTMLGIMIKDKSAVALYKAAQGFVKMFLYFITAIGSVVMPRIANLYAKNNKEQINDFINKSFGLACLLGIPMMMGMFSLSPNFFPWYLEAEPEIIKLVQFSCPIIFMIALSNVFGTQYLVPTEHTKEYTVSIVSGAIVNFCFNLVLIHFLGAVGACTGSVIAETTVTVIQYLFIRRKVEIKGLRTIVKCSISSVAMGAIVYVLGIVLPSSFIFNIIQILIGVIVYVVLLFIFKEKNLRYYINKFINRGKNEEAV